MAIEHNLHFARVSEKPLLDLSAVPWEENNVRDPFLLQYGETVYMYYVGGNEKGIALAKIPYGELHEHAALKR
jgi:predicted GH43/DUF377 family glycosyl hydrolase